MPAFYSANYSTSLSYTPKEQQKNWLLWLTGSVSDGHLAQFLPTNLSPNLTIVGGCAIRWSLIPLPLSVAGLSDLLLMNRIHQRWQDISSEISWQKTVASVLLAFSCSLLPVQFDEARCHGSGAPAVAKNPNPANNQRVSVGFSSYPSWTVDSADILRDCRSSWHGILTVYWEWCWAECILSAKPHTES